MSLMNIFIHHERSKEDAIVKEKEKNKTHKQTDMKAN